ncbi:uncharacterized protein [Dermacentor andersoni]|uniref:uncharacterized protein isoform X1 n=1 Tax=Dermacentor andersoni TaxID=34620 RepID=UPI0024176D53|nr:uncharacterized protein LOC126542018 isoform X2 [Dermacentor andersoni]
MGVAAIEIKAKKNAAKNARNDAVDGDVDKGGIQVSAKKKVSAKEKKRQAVVETMKVFLKSPSEAQPPNITINKSPLAPDRVNLSDVSASEGASGDAGGAEHGTVAIKLIKPAEIKKPSEVGKAASHNQSAPAAVSGSSVNGTASNASSLGNARVGNASSDKAAPVNSLPGNTSHGNTSVKTEALTDSSSPTNKNSASRASGAKEDLPADSPTAKKSASPVDESPAVGSPSGSKSPADVAGRNKLPEAKQPTARGSPAKDATGAVNQSVHQGSQTNKARPLDASAASEKSADKRPPVNGPPAGAPSGAEKSAAAQSAEESGDTGSAANNKGEAALPNQPIEEKHIDKTKNAAEHGADSLAPGPSAQRPLFCDVRKSILRPLASYCTHILFGRLSLKESNGAVTVRDFDSATQEQLHLASVLRPGWPHVSLMATLGGGGEDDIAMAKAFEAGAATLDAMATEAANLVRKRGLDGINVHWTVPDLEADMEAYAAGLVDFIKNLRKELGPSSIITMVLPNETEERNAAFNVQKLQPLVNFLFVSTHDAFSPNSALTHFNGPAQDIDTGGMFTAIADVMNQLSGNQSRKLCFTFGLSGVAYKVGAGAPLAKYVPLVGAADPSGAQSAPNAGQLPKEGRPITYDEVCKLNLTCHQAHVEKSCYDKVGDTWYGYVDEKAVASKAKWILKDGWENLCVVAWNVDADDVKGSCRGDASASYPLLRSLSQATATLAY